MFGFRQFTKPASMLITILSTPVQVKVLSKSFVSGRDILFYRPGCAWRSMKGPKNNGSDAHDTVMANVVIPGAESLDGSTIDSFSKDRWVWPAPGVSTEYSISGYRESGLKGVYKGIDINIGRDKSLNKPIGAVNWIDKSDSAYGDYTSIVASATGYNATCKHLNSSSVIVKEGGKVKAGRIMAKISKQGGDPEHCDSSRFYHLHFSIKDKPGMVGVYTDSYPNRTINLLKASSKS